MRGDKPIQKFSFYHAHAGVLLSCIPEDEGQVDLEKIVSKGNNNKLMIITIN